MTTLPESVAARIEPEPMSGCWLWTSTIDRDGYGHMQYQRRTRSAHRLVYTLLRGPIPKETLDHKCRVRSCVNPDHLVPATHRENLFAPWSRAIPKLNAERTECPKHGLPYHLAKTGRKKCPECVREYSAKYRASGYYGRWVAAHADHLRAYRREYQRAHR